VRSIVYGASTGYRARFLLEGELLFFLSGWGGAVELKSELAAGRLKVCAGIISSSSAHAEVFLQRVGRVFAERLQIAGSTSNGGFASILHVLL